MHTTVGHTGGNVGVPKAPFTLYNLTGLGTVPSPVWCNVNASDRARPTQMSCGPGPPRGGGLGPDRRGSARYDL